MPEDYEPNPWIPMSDPVDLKHLGKLAEELNECGAAVARCVIQGIDEREPITGYMNRLWLEDEIADVLANAELVIDRFGLDQVRIFGRAGKKKGALRKWHAQGAGPVPIKPLDPDLQAELGHHGPKARDLAPRAESNCAFCTAGLNPFKAEGLMWHDGNHGIVACMNDPTQVDRLAREAENAALRADAQAKAR